MSDESGYKAMPKEMQELANKQFDSVLKDIPAKEVNTVSGLQMLLSASQAREAELREKLEAAEASGDAYSARAFKAEAEYETILEHCRTLEARLAASQQPTESKE